MKEGGKEGGGDRRKEGVSEEGGGRESEGERDEGGRATSMQRLIRTTVPT